jgi:hypothetical protein
MTNFFQLSQHVTNRTRQEGTPLPHSFFIPADSVHTGGYPINFPINGPPNLLVSMNLGDIVDRNNVYFVDKYVNKVYKTTYHNTAPTEVADYSILMTHNVCIIEYAKYVAVSRNHIGILGDNGTLLLKSLSSSYTAWDITNPTPLGSLRCLACTNNDYFYLFDENQDTHGNSIVTVSCYNNNILTSTIFTLNGYLFHVKKDYLRGEYLTIITETYNTETHESAYCIYIIHNNVIIYTQPIEYYSPENYGIPLFDMSFSQFNVLIDTEHVIHDVVYLLCKSYDGGSCVLRIIDLTDQIEIESGDPVFKNAAVSFYDSDTYDRRVNAYATTGQYMIDLALGNGGEDSGGGST